MSDGIEEMQTDGAAASAPDDMSAAGAAAAADSLPWVEKYRPSVLSDLVSHTEIIQTLQKLMDAGSLPNLLFYGPPGTGKTSTMLACARQLYGNSMAQMVLEVSARCLYTPGGRAHPRQNP
jgi:replication factor C subunit 3/5